MVPETQKNNPVWQRLMMGIVLAAILIWIGLSIYAAAKGADWAKQFFNSPPLAAFWLLFTLLLTLGLVIYPRLRRNAGSLLIHAGSVFILIGAMWGSADGHRLQKRLFGIDKVPTGYMLIPENESEHQIYDAGFKDPLADLPFEIYLHDFAIEYYWDRGTLRVSTPGAPPATLTALPGATLSLPAPNPGVTVLRQFKNFKIGTNTSDKTAVDDPQAGSNPALEVELRWPDGRTEKKFIFEHFPEFNKVAGGIRFHYSLMPSEFLSDLEIRRDGQTVLRKTIEVNKPLHYGGYYFYQASYDRENGQYTILSVTSDTGRATLFAGFALVQLGLCGHCWRRLKPKDTENPNHGN
jgi:hypothetical protein